MKTLLKSMLALFIVFSAISARSADPDGSLTVCKIMNLKGDHFKVIYKANERQDVSIKLYDNNDQIVYRENLKSSGFIKEYDLKNLPLGNYHVKVSAEDQVFEEKIQLGADISEFNLRLVPSETREVSFVGSHKKGIQLTLYILDGQQEVVYKEQFDDTKQIHKTYKFENLYSNKVSFVFYHNNRLISQKNINL